MSEPAARDASIGDDTVLARAADVLERRTSTSVIVLGDAEPTALRGTGVAVWDAFATPSSVAAAAVRLASRYGASPATVLAEMRPVLDALCRAGALQIVEPASVRPRLRADLTAVELDGELVVYDERNHALHHLNSTATEVWNRCDGRASAREIAVAIAIAYELDPDDVLRDVTGLLDEFRGAALLEDAAP